MSLPPGFDSWKQNAPNTDVPGEAEDAYQDYIEWAEEQIRQEFEAGRQAGTHDCDDFGLYLEASDILTERDFFGHWQEQQEESARWRYLDARYPNL